MNSLSRHSVRAAFALALLLPASAYAQLTTGSLQGTAASGDSVTVRNIKTEHTLDYAVGHNGRFQFVRLPVGIYEVVIHHPDGSTETPILARARLGETVQVN
jgi:hypothetical protein